jgi:uncharacterized membrane protein YedE/YeeE
MRKELKRFFVRLIVIVLILAVVGTVIYILQTQFHLFDEQIKYLEEKISLTERGLQIQFIAGLSIGTALFVIFITLIPLFMRKVDNKTYVKSLQRGILSAFVFFISDALYKWLEEFGRVYMIIAVIVVVLITIILIELFTLSMKEHEEKAVKTDLIAAIVSGLLFGVILKIIMLVLDVFHIRLIS